MSGISSDGFYDESAHYDSAVEWWFIQGSYDNSRGEQRHFMAAAFRGSFDAKGTESCDSHAVLLATLDPDNGRNRVRSQVSEEAVKMFARIVHKLETKELHSRLLEVYANEALTNGPPRPIRLEKAQVKIAGDPFAFIWGDFSLRQTGGVIDLEFVSPGEEEHCRFRLRPAGQRMFFDDAGASALDPMCYVCHPRLELTGRAGGHQVTGTAWFDHQWGQYGWFANGAEQERIIGWDWLGINLSDGTDINLTVHRDMRTKQALGHHVVLFERGRTPRRLADVTAEPLRYWESPVTRISYPVAWRIQLPEIKAELIYEPLVDDQEIPFFGLIRAIWEGVGTISGVKDGEAVTGRARLELQGYGYVFDLDQVLGPLIDRIDRRIQEFFPESFDAAQVERYTGPAHWQHDPYALTTMLSNPLWDLMGRTGKRWRPLFGFLMLESLGASCEPFEELIAVSSELSHTAALVIDDIQDDSLVRRGEECIHRRYGVDVAISAANTAYFLPFLLLADHPLLTDKQRIEIYKITHQEFVRAHVGQCQDIYWSKNLNRRTLDQWLNDSLEEKLLQGYAYKTAAILEALAAEACVIAGSDGGCRRACIAFARAFGVAFQIVDDVLNFSDSSHWRKTCGEDLAGGKLTYVITRALGSLTGRDQEQLKEILCSAELRKDPSSLRVGIELIARSGVGEQCRQEARAMVETGWEQLSRLLPPSEPKFMLQALCASLLDIRYDT